MLLTCSSNLIMREDTHSTGFWDAISLTFRKLEKSQRQINYSYSDIQGQFLDNVSVTSSFPSSLEGVVIFNCCERKMCNIDLAWRCVLLFLYAGMSVQKYRRTRNQASSSLCILAYSIARRIRGGCGIIIISHHNPVRDIQSSP